MKQIIYISSDVKKMNNKGLLDILITSRENNKKIYIFKSNINISK